MFHDALKGALQFLPHQVDEHTGDPAPKEQQNVEDDPSWAKWTGNVERLGASRNPGDAMSAVNQGASCSNICQKSFRVDAHVKSQAKAGRKEWAIDLYQSDADRRRSTGDRINIEQAMPQEAGHSDPSSGGL